MRAKLLVGIVAALALVSVSVPSAVAAPLTPVKIKLSVPGLKAKSKAKSSLVRLRAGRNVAWKASPADPWVQVNPPAGVGATFITISVDPFTVVVGDPTPRRESIITFTGGDTPTFFPIVQTAESTSLDIKSSWNPSWEGETMTFPFTTWGTGIGFDCAKPTADDPINRPWLTLVESTYDPTSGRGSITLKADPNYSPTRSAKVVVTCAHKSKTLKVTQLGGPSLAVSLTAWNPLKRATSTSLKVTASVGTTWTAEVVTGTGWLTVKPSARQTRATIRAASNSGPPRVGTIRFTNGYVEQIVTVTQAGS